MYLFLTPGKTDGRVPRQQGAPTTDFLYDVCVIMSNIQAFNGSGGGGGGGGGKKVNLGVA